MSSRVSKPALERIPLSRSSLCVKRSERRPYRKHTLQSIFLYSWWMPRAFVMGWQVSGHNVRVRSRRNARWLLRQHNWTMDLNLACELAIPSGRGPTSTFAPCFGTESTYPRFREVISDALGRVLDGADPMSCWSVPTKSSIAGHDI